MLFSRLCWGIKGRGVGPCLAGPRTCTKTQHIVCDTLLMLGDREETWKCMWGQRAPGGERASVETWPLLGREDRVATECTRDEQLPVLQGQVPLHKHVQGDLVSDQTLPAAEEDRERQNQGQNSHTQHLPASARLPSHQQLQVLWPHSLAASMSSKYLQVITKMLKVLVEAAKKVGVEQTKQTVHDLRGFSPNSKCPGLTTSPPSQETSSPWAF